MVNQLMNSFNYCDFIFRASLFYILATPLGGRGGGCFFASDSGNIFKDNLYSTYYPTDELEDVCLYDFVANYKWYGRDSKSCNLERERR